MAKDSGWIKLYRSSFSNRLYFAEKFSKWQAWCDLLLLANHKDGEFRVRGTKVKVLRGQVGFSVVELAKRWQWSRGTAIRYLNELENEHQIVQQKSNITTIISIRNYEKYQKDGQQTVQDVVQQVVQQSGHKQEVKEIKEDKEVINTRSNFLKNSNLYRQPKIPTMDEVAQVFFRQGGTDEMAQAFFDKNESTGWFFQNSPIINFATLVPKYIAAWRKNEEKNKNGRKVASLAGSEIDPSGDL